MKIAKHRQICTCAHRHSCMKCDRAGLEQSRSQIVILVPGGGYRVKSAHSRGQSRGKNHCRVLSKYLMGFPVFLSTK